MTDGSVLIIFTGGSWIPPNSFLIYFTITVNWKLSNASVFGWTRWLGNFFLEGGVIFQKFGQIFFLGNILLIALGHKCPVLDALEFQKNLPKKQNLPSHLLQPWTASRIFLFQQRKRLVLDILSTHDTGLQYRDFTRITTMPSSGHVIVFGKAPGCDLGFPSLLQGRRNLAERSRMDSSVLSTQQMWWYAGCGDGR